MQGKSMCVHYCDHKCPVVNKKIHDQCDSLYLRTLKFKGHWSINSAMAIHASGVHIYFKNSSVLDTS